MKKLLSVLVALALLFTSSAAFADEESASAEPSAVGSEVEISFTIGDSVIYINGSPAESEAPYITDDGTVLVPLRIITEAFGASVTWEASGAILIEYPDVSVALQIGSTTASVNTHTEALPAAPVLTDGGAAMVPLRFLCETFGADVSYDESGAVTVTKSEQDDNNTVMDAMNDKDRIGDSLYGWSMNTPKDMIMYDRSADGMYTDFSNDNYDYLDIEIIETDENTSFDYDFADTKDSICDYYTLTYMEKSTDEYGNRVMHFKYRSNELYGEFYYVLTDKYILCLEAEADYGSDAAASVSSLISSFKADFGDGSVTYDLAPEKTEDGNVLYENEDLSLKFYMPSYISSYDSLSYFYSSSYGSLDFYSIKNNDNFRFNISIYSKTDTVSAQSAAVIWHDLCYDYYNKDIASVSDVEEYPVAAGENGFHYSVVTSGIPGGDYAIDDIYFEKGSYVYNFGFICGPEAFDGDSENIVSTVMSTLECEELDENEIGTIIMYTYDTGFNYTVSSEKWSLSVPIIWSKAVYSSSANFYHKFTGARIELSAEDSADISSLKKYAETELLSLSEKNTSLIQNVRNATYGSNTYYTFSYSDTSSYSGSVTYRTYAYIVKNGTLYKFTFSRSSEYGNKLDKEFEDILASFVPIK